MFYVQVNAPLVFISLMLNFFFIYCLLRPPEKIKQPMKLLLHTLVSCTVLYLLSLVCEASTMIKQSSNVTNMMFYLLSTIIMCTSMTTSAWLGFFYCSRIVPARRHLFSWMKKNVKSIIYCAWIFERVWTLCDLSFLALRCYPLFQRNVSMDPSKDERLTTALDVIFPVSAALKSYFLLSIGVMLTSDAVLALYLLRHVRRMLSTGGSVSEPKFWGQLRVAVSISLQGILYLLCAVWISYKFFYEHFHYRMIDSDVHLTIVNVYMFCTTLNLWQGHHLFRQRTVAAVRALKGTVCGSLTPT